ncbi:hypothetical protein HK104_009622 [Borealophlyctis nickersoniae]|nr:hypothetical protein HK104_009622 [Borealophlyctis nickersoniae]
MVTIDRITLGTAIENLVAKVIAIKQRHKDAKNRDDGMQPKRKWMEAELADPTGRVVLIRQYGVILVQKNPHGSPKYLFVKTHQREGDHHGMIYSIPTDVPLLRDTEKDAATRALINVTLLTEYSFTLLHAIPPIMIQPDATDKILRFLYLGLLNTEIPDPTDGDEETVLLKREEVEEGGLDVPVWVKDALRKVDDLEVVQGLRIVNTGDERRNDVVVQTRPPTSTLRSRLPGTVLSGFLGGTFAGPPSSSCTLREDLLQQVSQLASQNRFDYLLIESSGISEPLPVAETFEFESNIPGFDSLMDVAKLDTMVTVVDSVNFLNDFWTPNTLRKRHLNATPTDTRTVVDLLRDQVEFANVILLSKPDLIPPSDLTRLKCIIQSLNPTARILVSEHGNVDPREVMGTGLFSLEKARESKGWLVEPRGAHIPETIEYNITHTLYTSTTPFHPHRLWKLVHNTDILHPILRSKGFIYVATNATHPIIWSQTARITSFTLGGVEWEKEEDKRQCLVFIRVGLDEGKLRAALDKCLLTRKEMGMGARQWVREFWDPFRDVLKAKKGGRGNI